MKHFIICLLVLITNSIYSQTEPSDEAIDRLNLGIDYFSARQFPDAIKAYTSAIASFPQYFKAYYYRSQAHLHMQDYISALGDLKKSYSLESGGTGNIWTHGIHLL